MSYDFTLTATVPATPQEIYDAWLDAGAHAAMTGGAVTEASTEVGGAFDAWNGYIHGTNVVLEPGRRIVQAWRTTRFADDDPDSRIEIVLEPVEGGTLLTLNHTGVPDGHDGYRDGGWENNYFTPMRAYFGR